MHRELSEYITLCLVNHKIIDIKDREYYTYGLELLLSKAVFFATVFVLSLLTNSLILSMLFLGAYMSLRQYTGGYHCKSSELCFLLSVFIYLLMTLTYKLSLPKADWVLFFASLASLPVIAVFSPIASDNNPITTEEKIKYKRISVVMSLVYMAITFLALYFHLTVLFYAVSWSLAADAVLMVFTKTRREKSDEKDMSEADR